jgi:hypothetical protein
MIFEEIVAVLQIYNDVDIWEKGCGIMHLEEKLYIAELLLPYIDFF